MNKILGRQKISIEKIGLGFGETSCKKILEEKVNADKTQVSITVECIEKSLKNILQIGNHSKMK